MVTDLYGTKEYLTNAKPGIAGRYTYDAFGNALKGLKLFGTNSL